MSQRTSLAPSLWRHLRDLLLETGHLEAIDFNPSYLDYSPAEARARLLRGDPSWETMVPAAVAETGDSVQVTWSITVERPDADKPCVVAEWIVRYYPA